MVDRFDRHRELGDFLILRPRRFGICQRQLGAQPRQFRVSLLCLSTVSMLIDAPSSERWASSRSFSALTLAICVLRFQRELPAVLLNLDCLGQRRRELVAKCRRRCRHGRRKSRDAGRRRMHKLLRTAFRIEFQREVPLGPGALRKKSPTSTPTTARGRTNFDQARSRSGTRLVTEVVPLRRLQLVELVAFLVGIFPGDAFDCPIYFLNGRHLGQDDLLAKVVLERVRNDLGFLLCREPKIS